MHFEKVTEEVEPGYTVTYRVGKCDRCDTDVHRYEGEDDVQCPNCHAIYNCFGQRLRDDLYTRPNPSSWDDNISDLDGDEMSWIALENE